MREAQIYVQGMIYINEQKVLDNKYIRTVKGIHLFFFFFFKFFFPFTNESSVCFQLFNHGGTGTTPTTLLVFDSIFCKQNRSLYNIDLLIGLLHAAGLTFSNQPS